MRRTVGIVILVVILVGGIWWWRRAHAPQDEEAEIVTAEVTRGDLRVAVAATGVLEPLTTVEVKSRSGGEIRKLFVDAGDVVEAGQLIAQLDPTELQGQVDQAAAQVRAASARVDQAHYNARAQKTQTRTGIEEARAALATQRARLEQARTQLAETRTTTEEQIRQAQAGLESARARLAQAVAQEETEPTLVAADVTQAQAGLERARQDLAVLEAGARPQEIAQAQARVDEAQVVVNNARVELDRQRNLLTKGFVSQQTVDTAQRTYDTALAQLTSAREALSLLRAGSRAEEIERARAAVRQAEAALEAAQAGSVSLRVRSADREAAEAAVKQAEATLATARAGRQQVKVREGDVEAAQRAVDQAAAALDRADSGTLTDAARALDIKTAMADLARAQSQLDDVQYNFDNTSIVAPRSGVVLAKHVEEGTVIPAGTAALAQGTAIVTIADITEMFVLVEVDEVDISRVAVGQPAELSVETLPNTKITGEVEKIFPNGTKTENVVYFQVRVRIDELDPRLRPGMTADVNLISAERKDVLLVPDAAIDRAGGRTVVEVLEPGATEPVERAIEVGVTDYENTEVISGLKEGDTVVLPSVLGNGGGASGGPGSRAQRTPQEQRAEATRRATGMVGRARGGR